MSTPTPYPAPHDPRAAQQPYAQPGTYSGGYFIPVKRPFSQLAVFGFVASFVGLGLIGLPLSIAGLVVTQRHPHYRGSALAIFGIVIGAIWAVFNVSLIGAALS